MHVFRHTFARRLLEAGTDIRAIEGLFGHSRLLATTVYPHVLNRRAPGVASPADRL